MGYHRAGFDIVGVDIKPQPNYPFGFVQADALEFLGEAIDKFCPFNYVDAIHASPPCQVYSTTSSLHDNEHPDLIAPTRNLLAQLDEEDVPWVIENVVGAPLLHPFRLCGSSFGLGVRRHRLFETNWPIGMVPPCSHHDHPRPLDVTGTGASRIGDRKDGGGGNSRKPRNLDEARSAMGINWMSRVELSQAIPPAYTEFIGHQLLAQIGAKVGC